MGINHFILTLISFTCLLSISASTNAPPPLFDASSPTFSELYDMIEQICGNTDHPVECIIATMPFLNEKTPIEPLSVLKAGIEAMDNQTKYALAEVTKLSMDPTTPKNVVPILQTCIDVYNSILNSDQKSLEAISNRNLVQLSTELGTNVENILGCDNAFKQAKLESPMKKMDAMLGKIISNTLTIGVDMVQF
ncbi:hypothetical protein CXB51_030461 [Gossypium anomalum]|uniref:Pectinesterase inhibitor domain-containing protein n=1 Tax=Gossypium anomalum TaxID=47600 RepID=A0A8J5YCR8_9ROSI|nr:hypothetical protein CXB51_030461 [Gossypium anomalum]